MPDPAGCWWSGARFQGQPAAGILCENRASSAFARDLCLVSAGSGPPRPCLPDPAGRWYLGAGFSGPAGRWLSFSRFEPLVPLSEFLSYVSVQDSSPRVVGLFAQIISSLCARPSESLTLMILWLSELGAVLVSSLFRASELPFPKLHFHLEIDRYYYLD